MRPAKTLFAFSMLYLFAIFAAYLADTIAARCSALPGASDHGGRRPIEPDRGAAEGAPQPLVAIALALAAFVVVVYVATIVRVGPAVVERSI